MMKSNRNILISIFLCFIAGTQAQLTLPKKAYWHLNGILNKNINMDVNLVKLNDSVYADCCFFSQGSPLVLGSLECGKPYTFCGKMDAKGNFQVNLYGNEYPCLKGQLISSGTFRGDCAESNGNKPLHFELLEIYKAGSVQFNVYFLRQTVNLVKKPKSPRGSVSMALLSPMESGNSVISDTLRKTMLKEFNNSPYTGNHPDSVLAGNFRVYKQDYLTGNEDLYKQAPNAASMNWELLKFMHIICNDNYILSFYILNYAFTGGAHGLENLDLTNINLKTSKVLKLENLLVEGKKQDLSKLLTKKLKLMIKIKEDQRLSDNGYFTDEIQPCENFYLTSRGIGFLYNHYDIAPYSFGTTDIYLTADEVKGIILPFMNGF
ncbi:MAG: DUF3298 domain-containing protein [Bacteroidetes bacterium]|nr:DUF3298 domain-containing protein [Bacteroidota bacterium]